MASNKKDPVLVVLQMSGAYDALTTSELSLHRCPAAKARRVATPSNSGHSAHGS